MFSRMYLLPLLVLATVSFGPVTSNTANRNFIRRPQGHRQVQTKQDINEVEVRELFQVWNNALQTLNSTVVAQRYAKRAVLLPTVSDIPRNTPELIKDYFDSFLKLQPSGVIVSGNIRIGNNWAEDSGTYEFTFGATGATAKARYTYMYIYEDDEWKISHHHSSQMPEGAVVQENITESDVRSLFYLWNNALGTLDSEKVLSRYAKDAVLLATVSDTPRTTPELIKAYFDQFLKNEPTGVILESFVKIGANYAIDVGIYEFTFRASGTVVQARYSFAYVYENGIWKIKHHHSSLMPEQVLAPAEAITPREVRSLYRRWNDAMATLDEKNVVALYDDRAVVIGSDADEYFHRHLQIEEYYRAYLQKKPQCTVVHGDILIGHNWAQDAGICNCTYSNNVTETDRFTMVYKYDKGDWKITHRHSSFLPEAKLASAAPKF